LFSAIRDLFVLVVAIVIVIATIAALAGLFVGIVILVARSVGG
jgi:biopolymer transport protein ExbB/TolQ